MIDSESNIEFDHVLLPPTATTSPETIVRFLVQQMVTSGRLHTDNFERLIEQVLRREMLGSTGIGHGFGIPHADGDDHTDVLGTIGRLTVPVDWPGAMDALPVHVWWSH